MLAICDMFEWRGHISMTQLRNELSLFSVDIEFNHIFEMHSCGIDFVAEYLA